MLIPHANPCDDGLICNLTYELTGGNEAAANWSDVLVGKPLAILGLLLLGFAVRWLLHRVVDRVVKRAEQPVLSDARDPIAMARRKQRAGSLAGVLKSIVTLLVVVVIGTMALNEFGVNIAPLIASAGIVGLALGFGAQSLVKDFLSGIFILAEDQFGVGDWVDLGEAEGEVEGVTLRTTRLRGIDGVVWYVPNGEILRVGNASQNWARALVDVGVAYGSDLARVKEVLSEVAHELYADEAWSKVLLEKPFVTGVESLAADSVMLRVMIKTRPLEQWAVARELRERIKARFDRDEIEIPFPQRVLWHRDPAGRPTDVPTLEHE